MPTVDRSRPGLDGAWGLAPAVIAPAAAFPLGHATPAREHASNVPPGVWPIAAGATSLPRGGAA